MLSAVDVGHAELKFKHSNGSSGVVPAVLGEVQPLAGGQSLNGYIQVKTEGGEWFVGQAALEQSRNKIAGRDTNWLWKDEWLALMLTAISEGVSSSTHSVEIDLVTGLPFRDWPKWQKVKERLIGTHSIERPDRRKLAVNIRDALLIPQGLAAVSNLDIEPDEQVALLDIGGRNMNWSTLKGDKAIGGQGMNGSNEFGIMNVLDDICREVEKHLGRTYLPFEIAELIKNRKDNDGKIYVKANGKKYDISKVMVLPRIKELTGQATTVMSAAWGDMVQMDRVVLAGGGAALIGDVIKQLPGYERVEVLDNPQMANVNAYFEFGKRKYGK